MKNISFFLKILWGYILLFCILTTLIFGFSFKVIKNQRLDNLKGELKEKATLLYYYLNNDSLISNTAKLDSIIKKMGSELSCRFTIIHNNGKVLADSEENPTYMDNHINRNEIQAALDTGMGHSIRYSITVKTEMLYVALLKEINNEKIFVRTSLWLKEIDELIFSLKFSFFQSVLLMLIISLLLAFIFSKSITKPINKLALFSKQLSKENFRTRINYDGKDEIGQLAKSLNLMADEIESLFKKLDDERDELDAIINNIRSGLLVFNKNDQIILANQSAKNIFKLGNLINKHFWELIPTDEFQSIYKKHRENKEFMKEDIQFKNLVFRISFVYMQNQKQSICVLNDITEAKKLEKTKKDFVTNVSHELRTPLTAIKGFVETLEDDETDPSKKHYLTIIQRNTERLINIVKDLLMLSNLESARQKLELEEIDLHELILNVSKIFEPRLQESKISFEVIKENNIKLINADYFRLEQVFINLIDNAIKYSNASKISITLEEKKQSLEVSVKDNGVGIKKENIDRIFERFYVVDKSRSRKLGGTGLGLSLVKHIIQQHNGDIRLESDLEKGSNFIITFYL